MHGGRERALQERRSVVAIGEWEIEVAARWWEQVRGRRKAAMRRQDAERENGSVSALLRDLTTKLPCPEFSEVSLIKLNYFYPFNLLIEPNLIFIILYMLCWILWSALTVKLPDGDLVVLSGSLFPKEFFEISYLDLRSHWCDVLLASISFLDASQWHCFLLLDLLCTLFL